VNNPLDIITIFRVSALLFLLLSAMTWMMLGRPRRGATLLWCLGGALVGVSVWLISLRNQISDFWSYSVAQTLFLGSFLVHVPVFAHGHAPGLALALARGSGADLRGHHRAGL